MISVKKHSRWSDRAAQGLCQVLGEDATSIAEGVNTGRLELWECHGGELWMVTTVDNGELIVCCMQGRGMRSIADVLWRTMQREGLKRARMFTQRPTLAKSLTRMGYPVKLLGYVYTVEAS